MTLRWYQHEAIKAAEAALQLGPRRALLTLATGLGKSRILSSVSANWRQGHVLALAHRDELVFQLKDELENITGLNVGVEKADSTTHPTTLITVGSIQSFNKRRLERLGRDRYSLIILDECFPAGSLVDGRPIESLKVGDEVRSVDHSTGSVVKNRVARVMSKKAKSLVRVSYGDTEMVCTGNHPVFVLNRGYVQASEILPGDLLCVWRDQDDAARLVQAEDLLERVRGEFSGVSHGEDQSPARLEADEREESDAHSGDPYQGVNVASGHGAQAFSERRKRDWSNESGALSFSDYARGLHVAAAREDQDGALFGVPFELQDRHSASDAEDCDRGRWVKPHSFGAEGPGRQKGRFLTGQRVARVESIEPSSPDGTTVYNLEIENTHTYFINDTLVHNCHHAISPMYQATINWLSSAAVLGVTATPDRGDKRSLNAIFPEGPVYSMGIREGIDEGYLVPIRCWSVHLDTIDISGVSTRAGDLAEGQLDLAMVKAIEGIVRESIRIGGDRQGIAFFPGLQSALFAYERFNAIRPGSAIYIHAKTPSDERKESIARYRRGEVQYLCNVGIANEGFDAPRTSLIIQGAPTLSRPIYAQRIGRGTRTLPGVIDGHPENSISHRAQRVRAIANSDKRDCLVLDFVGNCGRHSLVTPVDVLAGESFTDEEKKLAKKKQEAMPGSDARKLLEISREELKRIAVSMSSRTSSTVQEVDPFDPFTILHLSHDETTLPANHKPLSTPQRNALLKLGVAEPHVDGLDSAKGRRLLNAISARRARGLASFNQLRVLQQYGVNQINLSFETAKKVLDHLASTGWGRAQPISKSHIESLIRPSGPTPSAATRKKESA